MNPEQKSPSLRASRGSILRLRRGNAMLKGLAIVAAIVVVGVGAYLFAGKEKTAPTETTQVLSPEQEKARQEQGEKNLDLSDKDASTPAPSNELQAQGEKNIQ